jgi:hypothetical protein
MMIHSLHWYIGLVSSALAWSLSANSDHLTVPAMLAMAIGMGINELVHWIDKKQKKKEATRSD